MSAKRRRPRRSSCQLGATLRGDSKAPVRAGRRRTCVTRLAGRCRSEAGWPGPWREPSTLRQPESERSDSSRRLPTLRSVTLISSTGGSARLITVTRSTPRRRGSGRYETEVAFPANDQGPGQPASLRRFQARQLLMPRICSEAAKRMRELTTATSLRPAASYRATATPCRRMRGTHLRR